MSNSQELSGKGPLNHLRLGVHGEKKYFGSPDLFTGIVFNGTIVALTPQATASFVTGMDKPFWIDPLTYAFEQSPIHILTEDGEVKRSIRKLVHFFGKPLDKTMGKKAVSCDEFRDKRIKLGFCSRVLSFQKDVLARAMNENLEYLKEIGLEVPAAIRGPSVIIPPYFYLDVGSWPEWLDLNVEFVNTAVGLEEKAPIFCEIVFSKALLDYEDNLLKIADRYHVLNCGGFLIWVSDFAEHRASMHEIVSLRKFIRRLTKGGKPIVNLYGGYLSALLFFDGLSGFCHGPGYGEDRDIVPVGGGLPVPKYYFRPLHRRIPAEQVELFIRERQLSSRGFWSEVCNCKTCRETLRNSIDNFARFGEKIHSRRTDGLPFSYATEPAKELNNFHYLYSRQTEIENVASRTKKSLVSELRVAQKRYLPYFSSEWVSHLETWYQALSKPIPKS